MIQGRAKSLEVRCVSPVAASLGEGPLWIAAEAAVYWVDILKAKIFRYFPAFERTETCAMPFAITSLAPIATGGLICTGLQQIHWFDTQSGQLCRIRELDIDPSIRINDGCCHPDGAFWFGTMDLAERAPVGDFYRLGPDGICDRMAVSYTITNGPAFTPAGDCGYFVDTLGRRILRGRIEEGILQGGLHEFVRIPESEGYPDGLAVDAEGGVWCSHWGGGRVTRFDADARISDVIRLPVSNVTKCAFGGEHLDRLFITTARKDVDDRRLRSQPLAGGLFEVEVAYRGMLPPRYRGTPQAEATSGTCFFESS
jgi:D-xylonolactonase